MPRAELETWVCLRQGTTAWLPTATSTLALGGWGKGSVIEEALIQQQDIQSFHNENPVNSALEPWNFLRSRMVSLNIFNHN